MRRPRNPVHRNPRPGATTVELAVLLPFLCFMFVIAVDYARIFYFGVTLENCARNGAYYASNYPNANYIYNDIYGYRNLDEAILNDASNLYSVADPSTKPSYSVGYSSSSDGPYTDTENASTRYVRVTVSWTFQSISNFPGIPSQTILSRSATMKMAPTMPTFIQGS